MSNGRVLLAAPRSFCAGVDRAIEIVERLLEQHGAPVYVRHQIVHNEHVVRRLEALGAVFVEDESEIPAGEFCVLSAHGVAPSVKENAQARGLKIVDATCPLVNKVHAEARRYADSGHLVALVGHANHVEVIGTLGERPNDTVVIESPEEARNLKTDKPVAVITQTTLSLDDVAPIVDALGENVGGSLRRPHHDDICYATQNRQDAVKAMVEQDATLILVIGSENSSNAQRLVEVAQSAGAAAMLIDGESPLDENAARRARGRRAHRRRVDARGARARDGRTACAARLSDARRDHRCPRGRSFPAAEGGCARMTSIEVPYSIAAALPTLSVMDVTNDVAQTLCAFRPHRRHRVHPRDARPVARAHPGARDGLLRGSRGLARADRPERRRRAASVSSPRCSRRAASRCRSARARLCLGRFQRILLFSLDAEHRNEWTLTLLG